MYPGGVHNKGPVAVFTQLNDMWKKNINVNDEEVWLDWIMKFSNVECNTLKTFTDALMYEWCCEK